MSELDLQKIRGQLDEADAQLVKLFEERMRLCGEVAASKIESGKAVYDRQREQQKLEAVEHMAHSQFDRQAVRELFVQIMAVSRRYQYKLLAEHGLRAETFFRPVKELPVKDAKVVYQGVEGAYSHAAAARYFGESASFFHVPYWEDAMKAVESGEADYAVLPIENSSAGMVSDNYDLLVKYHNTIVGEIFLPVGHALLGLADAHEEEIRTVYSHPQALLQCSEFLNSRRDWKQISVENTAVAAKKVLEEGDGSQAAVASETAGRLYGLKILRPAISNNRRNTTRFIVLAKEEVYREDAGKISVCFELPHRTGSLYNMLGNFIFNQVNMVMIQSRPIPEKNWEYRFYVDLEGNLSDISVQNALKGISEEASYMRILGNY